MDVNFSRQMSSSTTRTQRTYRQRDDMLNKRLTKAVPVHEIFLEAIEIAGNDEFWRTHLLKASRNKFPLNFFMKNGYLCYRTPKGEIYKELIEGTPLEVFTQFKVFIQKRSGEYSDKDIACNREAAKFMEVKEKKSNGFSDVEIYKYLHKCKESWNMSEDEYTSYKEAVFLSFRFDKKKCLVMKGDKLVGIQGVFKNENTGLYYNEFSDKGNKIVPYKQNKPLLNKLNMPTQAKKRTCDFKLLVDTMKSRRKNNLRFEDILQT